MKQRSLLLPLMFISAIALGGCSDDQEMPPNNPDDVQEPISVPGESENMTPESEPTSKLVPADAVDQSGSASTSGSPENTAEITASANPQEEQQSSTIQ